MNVWLKEEKRWGWRKLEMSSIKEEIGDNACVWRMLFTSVRFPSVTFAYFFQYLGMPTGMVWMLLPPQERWWCAAAMIIPLAHSGHCGNFISGPCIYPYGPCDGMAVSSVNF